MCTGKVCTACHAAAIAQVGGEERKNKRRLQQCARRTKCSKDTVPATQYPSTILGKRIQVFWKGEGRHFSGFVQSYDAKTHLHLVVYDDGDQHYEQLNFDSTGWSFEPSQDRQIVAYKEVGKYVEDEDAFLEASADEAFTSEAAASATTVEAPASEAAAVEAAAPAPTVEAPASEAAAVEAAALALTVEAPASEAHTSEAITKAQAYRHRPVVTDLSTCKLSLTASLAFSTDAILIYGGDARRDTMCVSPLGSPAQSPVKTPQASQSSQLWGQHASPRLPLTPLTPNPTAKATTAEATAAKATSSAPIGAANDHSWPGVIA